MVYGLVACLLPTRDRTRTTLVTLTVASLVELSRLVHVPDLDAFRLTATGALLLGRVFSP